MLRQALHDDARATLAASADAAIECLDSAIHARPLRLRAAGSGYATGNAAVR